MAEITVHLWLLVWPDGRTHPAIGNAPPQRWSDLVASDGCRIDELQPLSVEKPAGRVQRPVEVKTT